MKHGNQHEITILDDLGSNIKETTAIYDYKQGSKFRRYEIRVRVNDKAEELKEYIDFQNISEGKLDPAFLIQKTKPVGYYHILKCYTERVEL
jgi:hypothetical protein